MVEYSWGIYDKWVADSGKSSWVNVTGQMEEGASSQVAEQKVLPQMFWWPIELTLLSYVKSRPKKKKQKEYKKS